MNAQIQKRPGSEITGTARDPNDVNARMRQAMDSCNLVSPATSAGQLPEGCGIAFSAIQVDKADCYSTGAGKFGLSKTSLQKIAGGAGVSWDAQQSGRLDNGAHPYYCRWRSVGTYRAFDGQVQQIVAEKEMDLRDGSPQLAGKSERQVAEMRAHIQSHCETKAQLRAIRSLGVKTGYTEQELAKPFVAARILFTGQSENPTLRKMFAEKLADSFLGGGRTLYGRSEPAPSQRLLSPPPVGSVDADEDDYVDYERKSEPPAQTQQQTQARPSEQRQASLPTGNGGGFTVPGGKEKGKPLHEASESTLTWWAGTISNNIETGASRSVERDTAMVNAMRIELAKRSGELVDSGDQATDGGGY